MRHQRHIKVLALVLLAFLALAVSPAPGHAEELFDSPKAMQAAIDDTLAEGMVSGHYGLTIKAAQFMSIGGDASRDSATRTIMNKAAWLNVVNAHRMLDAGHVRQGGVNSVGPEGGNPYAARGGISSKLFALSSGVDSAMASTCM